MRLLPLSQSTSHHWPASREPEEAIANNLRANLSSLTDGFVANSIVGIYIFPALDVLAFRDNESQCKSLRICWRNVVDHREAFSQVSPRFSKLELFVGCIVGIMIGHFSIGEFTRCRIFLQTFLLLLTQTLFSLIQAVRALVAFLLKRRLAASSGFPSGKRMDSSFSSCTERGVTTCEHWVRG